MVISGEAVTTANAIRLGGHIAAAVWIATVARRQQAVARTTGFILAAWLLLCTLLAPLIPPSAFMGAVLLMIAWLFMTARSLRRN